MINKNTYKTQKIGVTTKGIHRLWSTKNADDTHVEKTKVNHTIVGNPALTFLLPELRTDGRIPDFLGSLGVMSGLSS
jgi:hypothetical protein